MLSHSIDPLYRGEIGQPDLLSPEEVRHLAHCIEQGRAAVAAPNMPGRRDLIETGEHAKQRLVEANLRLVIHVARRYQGSEMDLMDLIQEGNLGLMHAADKYEYQKGSNFGTYAVWWIHQYISRALIEQPQMIHVPLYKMEQIKQLRKFRAHLEQSLEKEPQPEDLAELMGISIEEVQDLLGLNQIQDALSLDTRRLVGEDEIPLSELLEDDPANSPERIVMAQTLAVQIRELLDMLKPRERSVIRLRYGLEDGQAYSLPQTAKKTNLSPEGVRQAEARALRVLAMPAQEKGLKAYLSL